MSLVQPRHRTWLGYGLITALAASAGCRCRDDSQPPKPPPRGARQLDTRPTSLHQAMRRAKQLSEEIRRRIRAKTTLRAPSQALAATFDAMPTVGRPADFVAALGRSARLARDLVRGNNSGKTFQALLRICVDCHRAQRLDPPDVDRR